MGVFRVFFGCRGVIGFKAAMSMRPVGELVCPAALSSSCRREKVRPARWQHPNFGVFGLTGRVLSRTVGLATSRRPHSVTCPWHCGVRAVD